MRTDEVDPAGHGSSSLHGFTCGGGSAYEQEADMIVEQFRQGHRPASLQFVVGRDDAGDTIGVCAIHERHLPGVSYGAMYVGVIAISGQFRGRRLDDGTRLGDWLLHDSLDRLQTAWVNMPLIWALIDHTNQPSQDLFARHGFAKLPPPSNYAVYVRTQGLRVQ